MPDAISIESPRTSALRGLTGRNVLVTGGSSAIGQAIVVRFAEYGANVAINYLRVAEEAHAKPSKGSAVSTCSSSTPASRSRVPPRSSPARASTRCWP